MSPRRNFLLSLAYDGTDFHGWQRLPEAERSVQAELERCLSGLLGEPIEVVGAGRTDRGVHAEGQAASFHSRTPLAPEAILAGLAARLPPDLAAYACREVDPRFHARFRAQSKLYRYRLHLGPAPDPLLRRYSLHVRGPLDLELMRKGAALLVGERDFKALSNEKEKADTMGRVDAVRVEARAEGRGGVVDLLFEGPAFLYNQARIMAALLLELGEGRRSLPGIGELLAGGDRSGAPGALGPYGLCLMDVRYALPEALPGGRARESGPERRPRERAPDRAPARGRRPAEGRRPRG